MALKNKIAKSLRVAKCAAWGALVVGGITAICMVGTLIVHGKLTASLWFYATIPTAWLLLWTGHSPSDQMQTLFETFVLCVTVNGVLGAVAFAAVSAVWVFRQPASHEE